ncbi:hypothetical protein [Rhizobium sp. RU35A]|uniref:hypothetical protein n=1 Tax=Rhizobium sp. RU35A TaxID=1907414 RepID=UPI00122D2984|nr:hypothetical protein [Rhizobium sp. RU35A]
MTTINCHVCRDRIVVVTDGGFTHLDHRFIQKITDVPAGLSKTVVLPHLQCVVAARGPIAITMWLPWFASYFSSLPEMKEKLSDRLRKGCGGLLFRLFPKLFACEFFVAGYHERKPIAFWISSKEGWETCDIPDFLVAPDISTENLPPVNAHEARTIDRQATARMLSLLNRQRDEFGPAAVSGPCQMTQIFPSGDILTRIITKF